MTKWKRLLESKEHRFELMLLSFKVICPNDWTKDQAIEFAIMNLWGGSSEERAVELVGKKGDEAMVVLV